MTGTIYVEPAELMKHRWVSFSSAKILAGFTRLEFWKSEGVGFAGNLLAIGIGLDASTVVIGKGEWKYE